VPLTAPGDVTKETGHHNSNENIIAAICAALS
jgi:hypothetical protein